MQLLHIKSQKSYFIKMDIDNITREVSKILNQEKALSFPSFGYETRQSSLYISLLAGRLFSDYFIFCYWLFVRLKIKKIIAVILKSL